MVFSLPLQWAGAPWGCRLRHSVTRNSRARRSQMAQRGVGMGETLLPTAPVPWPDNHSSGASSNNLSQRGSKRAPPTDPPPPRRANQPSTASVATAHISSPQAHQPHPPCNASRRGAASRPLSTVSPSATTRRCDRAADDGALSRPGSFTITKPPERSSWCKANPSRHS